VRHSNLFFNPVDYVLKSKDAQNSVEMPYTNFHVMIINMP
jgi:hypothetical protein